MSTLKEKLREKINMHRPRTARLLKDCGHVVIDQVTIEQCIGGARDVHCLVTDVSYLDAREGIRFRGRTIPEVLKSLPKAPDCAYPYVEGFWYFLMTGEFPTMEETRQVVEDFRSRSRVPQYVFDLLRRMPRDTHPMTMFSMAILSMQRESVFAERYKQGMKKDDYWDAMYEDATNLMAKLPEIAAFIYRLKYKDDTPIAPDPELELGGNFAHMMGIDHPYDCVSRMHFILHSDHESGNVSAHTTHLVASALSDCYYALSAGMNGLAGPLHGLASQEVLRWIQGVMSKMDGRIPTEDQLRAYLWDTLKSGKVIPGYGHAVLRRPDPRFIAEMEFCQDHELIDPMFELVRMVYRVAPDILKEHGKTKNPWPNVDAHSGAIHWHFGVREYDFYTVLFGVGRSLGVLTNIVWDRALGYPLERPKSVTTDMLEEWAAQGCRREAS